MGTRRDIVGVTGKYKWGDWTITGALRHEHKEGTIEESSTATYGGTAFALPIDYDTERYDVSAAYSTQQLQANSATSSPTSPTTKRRSSFPILYLHTAAPLQRDGAVRDAAEQSRPIRDGDGRLQHSAEHQDQLERPLRLGDAERHVPGEHRRSFAPRQAAGGSLTSTRLGQGTSATSPDIFAQVYQGSVGVSSGPITNLTLRAKYGLDGRDVSIDQFGGVYGGGVGGFLARIRPPLRASLATSCRRIGLSRKSPPTSSIASCRRATPRCLRTTSSTTSTAATPRSARAGPTPGHRA